MKNVNSIFREELKYEREQEVVEEYLDEYLDYSETTVETTKMEVISKEEVMAYETVVIEELEISQTPIPDAIMDHQYMIQEQTFNGQYSSDDNAEDLTDMKPNMTERERKTQRHKFRQLTGKTACKYCDTVFRSKESLKLHECKYLECDPKNFICRVCGKELSKKTFSNHLHETLDCQYCNKKFVNPRNLKSHIKKMHNGEKFIPPQKQHFSDPQIEFDESFEPVLDETTGMLIAEAKRKRKNYPKKKRRLECGKFRVGKKSSRN